MTFIDNSSGWMEHLHAEITRLHDHYQRLMAAKEDEAARLRADYGTLESRFADEQTAGHENQKLIAKLRAALEPFGRNADNISLSGALAHITREDLLRAKALANEQEGK